MYADAAGTGARARSVHGSQRAHVALTLSCGSPSASGAGSRPTGSLSSPRARPSTKNSASADGADQQPAVKKARQGGAVREGSREALSAPRVVARGRPQPIEAAQGAAASVSASEERLIDREGEFEMYKSQRPPPYQGRIRLIRCARFRFAVSGHISLIQNLIQAYQDLVDI